jgi:N-acetylneuraminate synthase/N,N'-diacetyllegionaminate synthase
MALARELVRAAARTGADAAKFQSFDPDEMITVDAPKADYQIRATGTQESQYQRLQRMRLSVAQHEELRALCDSCGITFCSSPFDRGSAELLQRLNVPFFKIPSGEITNLPLLRQIGSYGRPVILSTGMSNLSEIETALEALAGTPEIVLLHCVSDYPARWEDANLRAMLTLRQAFHLPVGFSDHTEGIELPLVAVALGAVIIEKHLTLDRNMEGGDHRASLEPAEFTAMVEKIRRVQAALGDGKKTCTPSEMNVRAVARKSLVTRRFLPAGTRLTEDDIAIKRPGTGIAPAFLSEIIGASARVDIPGGVLLRWSDLDFPAA